MQTKTLKTLRQVIDEIVETNRLSSKYDIKVRFDSRGYSLLNLRNYLEPWHGCEAYLTDNGNIKFIPHDGDGTAAYIKMIGNKDG